MIAASEKDTSSSCHQCNIWIFSSIEIHPL